MITILCPYFFCSATVRVSPASIPENPDRSIIRLHAISHPLLSGTCIASLMYFPITEEAQQRLNDQEYTDSSAISREIGKYVPDRVRAPEGDDVDTVFQSLFGVHSPDPDVPPDPYMWALGGRADEDIQPPHFTRPKVRGDIIGVEVGKHMASIDEVIASLTDAAVKGGEAIAVLNGMQSALERALGAIGEARNTVGHVMGQYAQSTILGEYQGLLSGAHDKAAGLNQLMEEVKNSIIAGQEKGEEMVGRLLG